MRLVWSHGKVGLGLGVDGAGKGALTATAKERMCELVRRFLLLETSKVQGQGSCRYVSWSGGELETRERAWELGCQAGQRPVGLMIECGTFQPQIACACGRRSR